MSAATRPSDSRYQTTWSVRLRFLCRLTGLTAFVIAAIGVVLLGAVLVWPGEAVDGQREWSVPSVMSALKGEIDPTSKLAARMFILGTGVVIVTLLIELFSSFFLATGRRSTAGGNAVVQIALAGLLFVGVNVYSFYHHQSYDLTRLELFTLPPTVKAELKELREPTSIIVLMQHKTFGRLSSKPDAYDYAAERKIIEKVKDLANQFQEFGPQFRVVVLDVEEEGYEQKLARETKDHPNLLNAIKSASENCIFFTSEDKKVQRLSFNEFYQLDKTASKLANRNKGNLVLVPQGINAFTQRVFAIEEKKPRIGIAVIHELLSTQGARNELTLRGMRQSLEANGFEVVDIVLKRWTGNGPPEPAADTYEENRLDSLEADISVMEDELKEGQSTLERLQRTKQVFENTSLDELSRLFRNQLRGRPMTEPLRQQNLANLLVLINTIETQMTEFRDDLRKSEDERNKLLGSESTVEGRRINDVKTKMTRVIDTCDMLIVPRLTLFNLLVDNDLIPNRLYKLDKSQVDAIRRFMKKGKPVFGLFGPANEPGDTPPDLDPDAGQDGLEQLYAQLGIVFGNQTILYNAESKAFADKRSNPFGGKTADVPPLDFDTVSATGQANPVRDALRIMSRSTGKSLDLALRHPRPVYYQPIRPTDDEFMAEFLLTDATTWNESKPFPGRDYTPRYEAPKLDDPNKGTLDEERRGPFPVGVALATTLPADWIDPTFARVKIASMVGNAFSPTSGAFPGALVAEALVPTDAYTVMDPLYRPIPLRVAAIGQGAVFNSPDASRPELTPAREELLLMTCNWLLGRDERLPSSNLGTWEYPRVELSQREWKIWRWGAFLGLPLLFAYIGLVVLMLRKVR